MVKCFLCNSSVKPAFNFFCRKCYIMKLHQIKISDDDYIKYINAAFKCGIAMPNGYRFNDVHKFLSEHINDLKPLANILENILFLKLIIKKEFNRK